MPSGNDESRAAMIPLKAKRLLARHDNVRRIPGGERPQIVRRKNAPAQGPGHRF
jgi:hypothetical protein